MDFTSALYLGLHHSTGELPPWSRLTLGKPAALKEPPSARHVAAALAAFQGSEAAVLGTSTLHLFWDFFGQLARIPARIFVDAGAYPVSRWGVERAQALGAEVRTFRHHDPDHLRSFMRKHCPATKRTVVLTDGFCTACGASAPLEQYHQLAAAHNGLLLFDDTQALGILGADGGGSLRALRLEGKESIVTISSLAKAFGAPLAVLSGSKTTVGAFLRHSETRIHSSPPSEAHIAAAAHALAWNAAHGHHTRQRLARLISRFRQRMFEAFGTLPIGGCFPVQSLRSAHAGQLYQSLLANGVRALLLEPRDTHPGVRLSFIIRADHAPREIDTAVDTLARGAGFSLPGLDSSRPLSTTFTEAPCPHRI